ncbi:MAG: Mur ligase domain-containing protein [bacterium]|nr:Mur ligase domain-containing protein [bacterium]
MHIHLTGVGGVAMGNLAAMLKQSGHTVTGSDGPLYPPMSDKLRDWGIPVRAFDERNIRRTSGAGAHVDLVVIGNAISRGNAEVEYVLNERVPYMSMAAALSEFYLKDKEVIVVAGTHGKTTTTFLIDHLIAAGGTPPGLFAGGVRGDGMDGWRVSPKSPYFVIEGDEYDTAFFDKSAKFLHYRPRYLVVTSIEFDHADIYDNERLYRRSFERLLRLVPSAGLVVAFAADKGVRETLAGYDYSDVQWYASPDYVKKSMRSGSGRAGLRLAGGLFSFQRDGRRVDFDCPGQVDRFALLGDYNTANALAASLVAKRVGVAETAIVGALTDFPGVLRRQQIRLDRVATKQSGSPLTFIEDFAHHPTAVAATIAAVREAYAGRTLHVLFEPRSATSHRNIFQRRYATAFRKAHCVYLADIFNKKKVPPADRLDVRAIVAELRKKRTATTTRAGKKKAGSRAAKSQSAVEFGKDPDALFAKFRKNFRSTPGGGDVVLVLSNGAFGGIYTKLDEYLSAL